MKKYVVIIFLIIFGFWACKKEPHYTLKSKTKEYIAFFGKGSWWTYQIEGTTDTSRWEATARDLATQVYSKAKGERCFSNINSKDHFMGIGYQTLAKAEDDNTQSSLGEIVSNNTTIKGEGNLPLEDNVVVNGIKYNSVLHIYNYDNHPYEESWIAPNVGMIKAKDKDGKIYLLKAYKIEKL